MESNIFFSNSAPSLEVISDAMNPGATAFTCHINIFKFQNADAYNFHNTEINHISKLTVMFLLEYSLATVFVSPITPAFAAL